MDWIIDFLKELLYLLNEMAPYLLLGFFFAGLLHVFFPHGKVRKYFGGTSLGSAVNASLLGIPLPLCSCGVIPTGVSFYHNGASKGSSMSFLISTPQTGVDSILVTYSLLGLPLAIIRPIVALISGFTGGALTNWVNRKDYSTSHENVENTLKKKPDNARWYKALKYGFVDFLQDIAKWLVIGLVLAALISVLLPPDFFEQYIGNDFLGMLLLLVAAIPLYVCATGSVPIAAVLLMKGLSPGAALVFLMAGPATNVATITVLGKVFGRKTTLVYLLTIIASSLVFGGIINEFLPRAWFTETIAHVHGPEHGAHILPYWLKISSSIVLTLLLINGLIKKYMGYPWKKKKNINPLKFEDMTGKTIIVSGMTCNHCKANVEHKLQKIQGVDKAEADISTGKVTIEGDDYSLKKVISTIEELGYKYSGEGQ